MVYAYGLKEAIDKSLSSRRLCSTATQTLARTNLSISWSSVSDGDQDLRPEGMLPKIAFFAATIDEVTK